MRRVASAAILVVFCSIGLLPSGAAKHPGMKECGPNKSIAAAFVPDAGKHIRIDGKLEENFYKRLTPGGGFWQHHPENGKKPSFKTDIYVFFDKKNIYFSFRCTDPEPEKITADITPYGEYSYNDDVRIYIDTFGDKRTYKRFAINARGIKAGEKTVWDGDARIGTHGWSAEVRIPFKSLRFPVAKEQQWSVNFSRRIFRLNEVLFWTYFGRDKAPVFGDTFGRLTGLRDIEGGKNVEIFPYAGFRHSKSGDEEDSKIAGGLDLKYGISSNLTLDMTSSPDYSDVESDPFFYQLDPYEHCLQENRPFYSEASGYFQTPFQLFYSRRIINPTLAAKVTGKEKGYSVGLLLARDRREDASDDYHGTFRLKKDIFPLSSVGIIYSSIEEKKGWNRNIGLDIDLHFKDIYHISGMAAYSYNKGGPQSRNGMYRLQVERRVDKGFGFLARYHRIEPDVNVRAGLVNNIDTENLYMAVRYSFRWENAFLERIRFSVSRESEMSIQLGKSTGELYRLGLLVAARNRFDFAVSQIFGTLRPRLQTDDGELFWDGKNYDSVVTILEAVYNGSSTIQPGLTCKLADYYVYHSSLASTKEGMLYQVAGWVNFKINPQLQLSVDYGHTKYYSDDRTIRFKGDLWSSSLKWQISKCMSSFFKFQYDSNIERFQYDFLVGYEPANVSKIYLSIKNYSEHELRIFNPDVRSISVKISYLIRI